MTAHRDPDPAFDTRIADWLEADPENAPGQTLETVLAAFPSIPQRPTMRLSRRSLTMNRFAYLAAAVGTAMIAVVAVVGGGLLRSPQPSPGASVLAPASSRQSTTGGSWTASGTMLVSRDGWPTATLLANGKVLVAGGHIALGLPDPLAPTSAELYDVATGEWTETGSMRSPRLSGHSATLLLDGRVLVAGGRSSADRPQSSAELYDPSTGMWTATGSMTVARAGQSATLLPDGDVFVIGGWMQGDARRAEIYDPSTGTWTQTTRMTVVRAPAIAVGLVDGKVLVIGSAETDGQRPDAAETYDPGSRTWTQTAIPPRWPADCIERSARLADGRLLLICGGTTPATELYNPASGSWTTTTGGPFRDVSVPGTVTLLADGRVLVSDRGAGELYDPASGTWTSAALPTYQGVGPSAFRITSDGEGSFVKIDTATLLPDGRVLMTVGPKSFLYDSSGTPR